jgi:SOS response regulatory protein OraA/RecX
LARRKSPASATDRAGPSPDEAHALALGWLGARDLSAQQIRQRLTRRGVPHDDAERIVERLRHSGALDEARLARTTARRETAVKGRGPARVRARLRALGLSDATTTAALTEAMAEVDVAALLDRAIEKRTRGLARPLEAAAVRRIAAALVRQGFEPGTVLARLRRLSADVPDDSD